MAVEALAEGRVCDAGEVLRAHGEDLVRRAPGDGQRFGEQLLRGLRSHPELRPWAQWTAGTIYHLCGNPRLAEPLLRSATRSFRARRRGDLADRISLILLDVYAERLRVDRARRLAARLRRRFLDSGDRTRHAVALANLGNAEDAVDRIAAARRLWRQALLDLDESSVRYLLISANVANAASTEGRLDEALRGHRAIAAAAEARGLETVSAQAHLNLAEVELALGQVDRGLRRLHETAARADRAELPLLSAVARVELAGAELDLGLGDAAWRRVEGVIHELDELGLELELARAWRIAGVAEATRPAPVPARLAAVRQALGHRRYAAQRDLLEVDLAVLDAGADAASVRRASRRLIRRGVRHRGWLGLAASARLLARDGRHADARRLAREVLRVRGLSPWTRALAHHACAVSLPAPDREGLRHARAAVRAAEAVRGRLASAADRGAFLQSRGEVYLDLLWRLVERGRSADRVGCLDLLATLKAGWLIDELGRRADRGGDELVRRWQSLRHRLAGLVERTEGDDEPRIRRVAGPIRREVCEVEARLRDVETELDRRRPGCMLAPGRRGTARQLIEGLPADHAYAEYLLGKDDLLVVVAHSGDVRTHRLAGIAPDLRRWTESVRFHLDVHAWDTPRLRRARQASLTLRLRQLGEALLDSVVGRDWSVLWVAPDSSLYHLPWWALEDGTGRALVDRGAVTLVPGCGLAGALLSTPNPHPRSAALAAAGGDRLPHADAEIRDLARLWPGSTRHTATTRKQLLGLLGDFDLVHLAGHALYLDEAPGASGLAMDDGFVTVHDLVATTIRSRIISFGVCSGARVAESESHRFEGFLRVLLSAGARAVVGPVAWVEDALSRAFAVALFRHLGECSHPAVAFRRAVTDVRANEPHPASWGCFQLYGDGRPWSST
jgi:hypothetical protein